MARKARLRNKNSKLIVNVNQCHYPVVRTCAKMLNFKITTSDEEDWDIFWQDGAVQSDKLYRMKPYQRINHFPGMHVLCRKNLFARNLGRMQKTFPDEYNFTP